MSPPNHLHLNPFLSSYPPQPQLPPSFVSSPPNYQHKLIVASDGWHSAPELPLSHHHPIIVVVKACVVLPVALLPLAVITSHRHAASSCHPSLSSCRLLPSLCRIVMPPVAVVVMPFALLPLAVVVPPIVMLPTAHCHRLAALHRCHAACCPAAPCCCCAAHSHCHATCRRHRSASSCRPSPFVFLGSQLEELDQTKAP